MEAKKESAAPKGGKKEGKVTNQFNFCERASQTFNNAVRVRGRGATDLHSLLLNGFLYTCLSICQNSRAVLLTHA